MSYNYNNVQFEGNIVRDLEMKTIPSGKLVVDFSVAVNGANDYVNYIDCQAWEKLAEYMNSIATKGTRVFVIGSMRQDRWEDKNGTKRSKIKIIVNQIRFLMSGKTAEKKDTENDFLDAIRF
jgi:single-strand DNA-binding protein